MRHGVALAMAGCVALFGNFEASRAFAQAPPAAAAALDLFRSAEAEGDLPSLYDKATTPAPGRRVTYKIIRPDFFVVSGDVNGRVFYTRIARGSANNVALLRGYTLSYAASAKAGF